MSLCCQLSGGLLFGQFYKSARLSIYLFATGSEEQRAARIGRLESNLSSCGACVYVCMYVRSSVSPCAAGAFGLGTMAIKGTEAGMEFFAGYIVEQSLSVDNLFIFIMLFDYFKVPSEFQVRGLEAFFYTKNGEYRSLRWITPRTKSKTFPNYVFSIREKIPKQHVHMVDRNSPSF